MKIGWISNIIGKITVGTQRYTHSKKVNVDTNNDPETVSPSAQPRKKSTGRPPAVFDVEGAASLRGTRHKNGRLLTLDEIAKRYDVSVGTLHKQFRIFDAAEKERKQQADILARETAERQRVWTERQKQAAAAGHYVPAGCQVLVSTATGEWVGYKTPDGQYVKFADEDIARAKAAEESIRAAEEAARPKPEPPKPIPPPEPVTNADALAEPDFSKFFLVHGVDNLPHATEHEQLAVSIDRWDVRYREHPLFINAKMIWVVLDPIHDNKAFLESIAADRWLADRCLVLGSSRYLSARQGMGDDRPASVFFATLSRWAYYERRRLRTMTDEDDAKWTTDEGFVGVPQLSERELIAELTKMLPTQAELNRRMEADIWDGSGVGRINRSFSTQVQQPEDAYYDGTPKRGRDEAAGGLCTG
jgi:hypothetical protein